MIVNVVTHKKIDDLKKLFIYSYVYAGIIRIETRISVCLFVMLTKTETLFFL